MASDSPTGEHKDAFVYQAPGRSTPPPTTSQLSAKHESYVVDPGPTTSKPEKEEDKDLKDKDKDKDENDMSSPDANPGYKPPDGTVNNEKPNKFKDDKDKSDGCKLNGDKLDAHFMLPLSAKDDDDVEKESCAVNCMYYTMQCCECTIS